MNKVNKWETLKGKTIEDVAVYPNCVVLYFTDHTEAGIYEDLEIDPPQEEGDTHE